MDNAMIAGHTFPFIEVSGTAYDMGYQHGKQAIDLVHKYLLWIEKLTGKPRDELCQNARAFHPLIENLSPPLMEEIHGLADGAGISFDEALLCQARGEAACVPPEGCTAFALTGSATADGYPLAGQNQDLAPEYADVAILLHVCPSDGRPRALLFTFAGQLGYSGMNQYGLAHFANALYDCPWQMGCPTIRSNALCWSRGTWIPVFKFSDNIPPVRLAIWFFVLAMGRLPISKSAPKV